MLVIDDTTPGTAPKPSIFLHGVTGAGKSTRATQGGRPLVILTEPKAMSVLRTVNPQALGLVPQSTDDVVKLFQLLDQSDRLAAKGIDRIILDSFTDLTYSLPSWMKDPTGAQILLRMEIQEFGDIKNYALALVKAIQLAGYPSIIIARSTVKRVGRVEKIVPDGYGKSVEELPGKCLPTIEARFDPELGYVWDSTPDECSQRCGLPWVPQIWTGTCLDFLAAVATPQAVPLHLAPQAILDKLDPPPAWVDAMAELAILMRRVAPEKQVETVKAWQAKGPQALPELRGALDILRVKLPAETPAEAFEDQQKLKLEEKPPVSQAASDFADYVAEGTPPAIQPLEPRAKAEDVRQVLDLCEAHKVSVDSLWAYLASRGDVVPNADGSKNWNSLKATSYASLVPILSDGRRRNSFHAHLKTQFAA